ncbi:MULTISPECIES: cytochrome P450 [unclassified Rhodococcus (in: high G+C Gram-positive bacteria)]|uniref:cytochrome P450 n=1 Tax=unclassified Rhodococcus (in: high G+C Gram-positive bacteria) TaxID=192944 RepID=UPI00146E9E0F|nr:MULTISPECIES: cytochrome P450 [unclassified Rhodococcus (in: high G+C Gram-positive bacteria)]MBF0660577.1 cytochrome P450 [Rhodococcus sp. (in: high G+C Gram-positive bacteria)]NMD94366.1 cytochrome P450 [Rhodococcus sp. BL-253-APC-6A1W]
MALREVGEEATATGERKAAVTDVARLLSTVGAPFLAGGPIARRRPVMGLLERMNSDAATVREVARLRGRYGSAPLPMNIVGRDVAVVLSPTDVDRILRTEADAFTAANREKEAALRPFQPRGVLISRGEMRAERRSVNERALDTDRPLHGLAAPFEEAVADEAERLLQTARSTGTLDAEQFTVAWWRLVRRIVLGDAARDDDTLTDELWTLRSNGNWSFAHPVRHRLRDRFTQRLQHAVEAAPSDSLAGVIRDMPVSASVDAVGQIPHWLFAFDAAGMVTARTLAVLATHPEHRERARDDIASGDRTQPRTLDFVRACVLDTTRLWPTTPAILRDSLVRTEWEDERGRFAIPAGAAFVILASAFHRDPDVVPFADRFDPEIWLDGRAEEYPALVPFSAGPAGCPGRNLVLFVTSTLLASLLDKADFTLTSGQRLRPDEPLPATLNNFGLEFAVK